MVVIVPDLYEAIDETLLRIAEARERAEAAARAAAPRVAQPHLREALLQAEHELLETHTRLMRSAYFGASGDRQLAIGDAA